jgi:S-DNA-T family DNA segregation ATPase FtsK/SpoIIIE
MANNDERSQSANFNRPPRIQFPAMETAEVGIPSPPSVPDQQDQGLLTALIPVLGIAVMAIFYVFRGASGGGEGIGFAIPMLVLGFFTIGGTVFAQRTRKNELERRKRENELNYIRLLDRKRARLQAAHDAQQAILEYDFPRPQDWLTAALARDERLWERRPVDDDFATFRIGEGRIPSAVRINAPDPDTDSPLLDQALKLADSYRYLPNAPIVCSLQKDVSIGMAGKRQHVLMAARAAICNIAIAHAPQELHIHLITSQSNADDWRWMEWLPHASQSHRGGAADLIATDTNSIRNLMGLLGQVIDERKESKGAKSPHLFIVIDDPALVDSESVFTTILRDGGAVSASALCLVSSFENIPSQCSSVIDIEADQRFRYARVGADGYEVEGKQIDGLSVQDAEHIARALSAVIVRESGGAGRIPRRVDFLEMYGVRYVEDLRPKMMVRWKRPIRKGILPFPAPIGRESLAVDTEIMLDEDHHGPHGVLAGTTGSGKSELLQTLICSLVLEHDPRLLTLLLIDFKGGATFNVFSNLPHTVGTVTNLDSIRVTRALEALKAETSFRQAFLDSMNVRDINQYHRFFASNPQRVEDPAYKPLPHLFIIVDEFAQLAKEMPDFMRELVRTVQVGRSLGLHLLLGTQSPMDVITDEMNANLQFRICLRVQNIEASRAMLRRPDAAFLPSGWPGRGYFQVGTQGMFKQFQTAYVGGDYERKAEDEVPKEEFVLELVTEKGEKVNLLPDTRTSFQSMPEGSHSGNGSAPPQPVEIQQPYTVARAIVETIVSHAKDGGVPWMKPLLLPPLEERITLAKPIAKTNILGWDGFAWADPGTDHEGQPIRTGSAPVGLLDDVYNRTQNPLWIHLNTSAGEGARSNRRDGHVLVMGSPGSGKTQFIRTLAISLALIHSPEKLNMYFVSFTGTGLDDLGDLPHAERVIYGNQPERVRRLFNRLLNLLAERQAGKQTTFEPIVMVAIDQYEQFRDSYRDQHMTDLDKLINEGRAVGIYVVMTANGPSVVPDRQRTLMQQRVALELGDPADYLIAVGRVNAGGDLPAGRGFVASNPPLSGQIALPTLRAVDDDQDVQAATGEIVQQLRLGYLTMKGLPPDTEGAEAQVPAPIEPLPTQIPLYTLATPLSRKHDTHIVTPLGRFDDDAQSIFTVDWWAQGPQFIVTGPPGSGKTNLLQAAILSAAQLHTPQQLRFLLVDFNGRSLRSVQGLKHVIRRVTDAIELKAQLVNLQSEMNGLYSSLKDHNFDSDDPPKLPATVIVIDDYDQTSEALGTNPELLQQLRDHVRLHSDLGLYMWVAGYLERTSDPLIKQLLLKRSGFALSIKESLQKLNVRTTGLSNDVMPEGRMYVPQANQIRVVQTALIETPQGYVQQINDKLWAKQAAAEWRYPATAEQMMQVSSPSRAGVTSRESTMSIDTAGLIDDLIGRNVTQPKRK